MNAHDWPIRGCEVGTECTGPDASSKRLLAMRWEQTEQIDGFKSLPGDQRIVSR